MAVNPFSVLRDAANSLVAAVNSLEGTTNTSQSTRNGQVQTNAETERLPTTTSLSREAVTGAGTTGHGGATTSRSSTVREFHSLFNYQMPQNRDRNGTRNSRKRKKTQPAGGKRKQWTHKFVCLANRKSEMVPNMQEKCVLAEAGLGEKDVTFDVDGDAPHIHATLMESFPLLKDAGGFEIARTAERSNTVLVVVPAPRADGYTVPYLRSVLNQARGFVRPIQRDIKIEPARLSEGCTKGGTIPTEKCLKCGHDIQFHMLRDHLEQCNNNPDTVIVPHETVSEHCVVDSETEQQHQGGLSTAVHQEYSTYISLISDDSDQNSDEELVGDADFQAAIQASLADLEKIISDENLDETDAIRSFQEQNLDSSDEATSNMLISRRAVFQTTLRAIQRKNFSFFKPAIITFAGEAGVDAGGPKREFFRLLMGAIKESAVFSRSWFSHDLGLLSTERYKLAGKLVAWSILQGGGGPRCLSEEGYHIMKGSKFEKHAAIEAVADATLKSILNALEGCTTDADFQHLIQRHADSIAQYGYSGIYTSKMIDKDSIIDCLLKQHYLYGVFAAISQFFDGMNEIGGFGDLVKDNELVFSSVLSSKQKKLNLEDFKSIYKVTYSESGSNDKAREDCTIYCFELFLQDLEEGEVGDLALEDLLIFITGSDHIPPLGFEQTLTISFYSFEGSVKRRPWASTCSLTLNLPRGIEDPDDFKSFMKQSLLDCHGFGQV